MLLFFDQSSIHQHPRKKWEAKMFKRALGDMPLLYAKFDVLVVDWVPSDGETKEYLDRGWCWMEAVTAKKGHHLLPLSPDMNDIVAEQLRDLEENGGGSNGLINEKVEEILSNKHFTCKLDDLGRVYKQYKLFEARRMFREALAHSNLEEIKKVFNALDSRVLSHEDFANSVFDARFGTALHLALATPDGSRIAAFLLEKGAKPTRNKMGELPWERWLFPKHMCALRWMTAQKDAVVFSSGESDGSFLTNGSYTFPRVSAAVPLEPGLERSDLSTPIWIEAFLEGDYEAFLEGD